jgi:Zn-dependent metalloprotease
MKYLPFVCYSTILLGNILPATAQPLTSSSPQVQQSLQAINDQRNAFGLDEHASFVPQSVAQDALGQTHVRLQQYHNGVRVWGGEIISNSDTKGLELPQTAALQRNIQLETTPKLSSADVLAIAKKDLASQFDFSHEPTTELVVYPNTETRVLAQRATVAATELNAQDFVTETTGYQLAYYLHTELEHPGDTRHTDYLIDANTGAIIEKWDSLQTEKAVGTGKSQYSGTVSLNTNSISNGYELRDLTRPVKGGNAVYNLNHATSGMGTIYTNPNNTWGDGANFKEDPEPTTSANGQTAAVDALFGLQATWDMYKNVFGRNGIDGKGTATYARVHYDSAYDNAFYSDQCLCITYGDGTKLQTLTSLDVAAHEFSHGVCATTAGLVYNKESGGLNEANSDIMGAMAEFYVRGANGQGNHIPDTGGTWTQGEQITTPAYPLKMRFLYKPSKDGHSADAWSPTLAKLNVHYSSGPMNRAFYFLSQGATTSGETSSSYLPKGMSGIGNDKAAKIWFHALTTRMPSTTDYARARVEMIKAARDLFPAGGAEEIAVWNAFAAINVGSPWSGYDAPPTVTVNESGDKDTITFNATASDDKAVTKVEFLLDGTLVGESTAPPYTMTYDSLLQDDGSHTLVARATDTSGQYTDATTTFKINNGQLVRNGSFEKGYGVAWSNTNGMQIGTILGQPAFDGTKMAKFGGMGSSTNVALYQTITIPASAPGATLSFALKIDSQDTDKTTAHDTFVVQLRNSSNAVLKTLATYSNLNAGSGFKTYTFDLADYKSQTVQLYFLGTEDAAIATSFFLDRVHVLASGVDDQVPTVSVSETGSSGMISFNANASDNDKVSKVEFFVDDKLVGTATTAPYNMTFDSTKLTNGKYTLTAKAYDAAGNVGTATPVSFSINHDVVDPEPPKVSVSATGSSGTISFNANASDNVGVTKVEFYVDNTLKGTASTAPYSLSVDAATLSKGEHSLMAKAFDAAGNVGTSATVSFNVDGTSATTYNEVENNGGLNTANLIADSVTKIIGYLGQAGDQDVFKINVAAGHTLTVNMTGPAKDYDLYLLNSKGFTLKTSSTLGSDESVSIKNGSATTTTYYLKVIAFGGAYTTTTPYNLSLSR